MKRTLLLPLSLVAAMMLMATTACAHNTGSKQDDIAMAAPEEGAPIQVDTIEIMSQAMGRTIKNVVVTPWDYHRYADEIADDVRYPVLYLLHGAYGCYADWSRKADLASMASQYGFIIVCPDGQDSWYFDSPVDPKMQFETYVSQELVAYIDSHYRTYANRYMRAITGLSMGGHGSLFLAFRHPDVFWSCGSMSGCMDITKFPEKWHIKDRLGEYASNKQSWQDHAVCNQIDKVKASTLKPAQNIIIDDGTKDIFYSHNVAMHEILLENNIDHDFIVRPGAHSWDYWVNALDYHMVFFSKAFIRGFTLMNQPQSTDNQ